MGEVLQMTAVVLLKMHGLQYHFDNLDMYEKIVFLIKNLILLYRSKFSNRYGINSLHTFFTT